MKKQFYTDIIEVNSLHVELDQLGMSDDEKKHIKELIDSSIYHTVLDAILSELSEEDKKIFLQHLLENDHSKIWEHVNSKATNIEDKIVKAAEDLKKELRNDILKVKK